MSPETWAILFGVLMVACCVACYQIGHMMGFSAGRIRGASDFAVYHAWELENPDATYEKKDKVLMAILDDNRPPGKPSRWPQDYGSTEN